MGLRSSGRYTLLALHSIPRSNRGSSALTVKAGWETVKYCPSLPALFLLSILVFLSVRFIPGDVVDVIEGRMEYSIAGVEREAVERRLGLDVPVYVQYGRWLGGILLQGSLWESLMGHGVVEERIIERLPVTIELGVLAIAIGILIALPVGVYSAIRQDTAADYVG